MLRCNFVRLKPVNCYYVVLFSFVISYFVVNTRYSFMIKHNINLKNEKTTSVIQTTINNKQKSSIVTQKPKPPMKYILLWTAKKNYPFIYFGTGNSIFTNKSCKWTNCYVTGDRNFLGAYTEFEVIAFNGPQLSITDMPKERQLHQKYVYANIESAAIYPFRMNTLNGFFNWTWTYKLNSDAVWGYVVVRNANNTVIGPSDHMKWINVDDMDPIDDKLKLSLRTKKKAAAWLSSACTTPGRREDFVQALQQYLKNFKLKIDIFGSCGDHQCPKTIMSRCLRMLKRDYYFYLSFENSFADDYVTEKLLYPLKYDTIPVVYGGANYSRFLPEGIYLDAIKLGPRKLAETMFEIINDRPKFYKFFRWKKYYSFHYMHESLETDSYCNFCAMMNNDTLMNEHTSYNKFNAWWMHKVTKII